MRAEHLVVPGLLLGLLALLLMYLSRRRALALRVGSFACRLQRGDKPSAAWTAGVAQYGVGHLAWYRGLSLSPRPVHVWQRSGLELLGREGRAPMTGSDRTLVRLRCRYQGEEFDLTVSRAASAGLVSWLEAGPAKGYHSAF